MLNSQAGMEENGGSTASVDDVCSIPDVSPEQGADAVALPFPVVAVAASAGGVEALRRLFAAMPERTGCAFVVIMHLDPNRESVLVELLQRATAMPVSQATEAQPVERDRIYVIPPGQYVELRGGRLALRPMRQRPPKPMAADRFMVSLATHQKERAIGIVLTGADGDGTIGVKSIKSEGGLTIAQEPESAQHPSMPVSALATGAVDCRLTIESMPHALLAYIEGARLDAPARDAGPVDASDDARLAEVLSLLRARTGCDFRGYKKPMLLRRVHRRMGIGRQRELAAYLQHLHDCPGELTALADDFLIGVTEFFREPDAWRALGEEVIPRILQDKSVDEPLRVWVPACSTGEEAYTLAMLLLEHLGTNDRQLRLQIFATDVNRRALELARAGIYPESIAHAVTPERLARFFVESGGHYQVCKELRDAVVFAPQSLIGDPPFSRMDLISCRNLLIYMEPELQRRVMQLFHFALNPGGFLCLGKSETVGSQSPLFETVSQRCRIYRSIGTVRSAPIGTLPVLPGPPAAVRRWQEPSRRDPGHAELVRGALLEQYASAGAAILIDRGHRVLYFFGAVQGFLAPAEGAPTNDLLTLLRDGLRPQLRAALHKLQAGRPRVETTASMIADGREQPVRITVAPVARDGSEGLLLVTFQHAERFDPAPSLAAGGDQSAALHALDEELRSTRRELQAAIEEMEAANEELKVANEEAMSMNEELQSTNEELETSKEELQAVNEELTTVNNELQDKVLELEVANNDLGNLLSSTHIPTLFLDRQCRVKRFTPAATRLFRLILTDVSRPLTDIAGCIDSAVLLRDARRVLDDLVPVEREIRADDGEHFLMRTLPYRTLDNHIDGIVVTFTDITEIKRAADEMRRLATVMQTSNDAIIVFGLDGRVLAWNRGAQAMYGYTEDEARTLHVTALVCDDAQPEHARLVERVCVGETVKSFETCRRTRDGAIVAVSVTLSVLTDDAGAPQAIVSTERDVTERKRAEQTLRESETRFRTLADGAPVLIWMSDAEARIEFINRAYETATGHPAAEMIGRRWTDLVHPDDLHALPAVDGAARPQERIEATVRMLPADGGFRWTKLVTIARSDAAGRPIGHIGSAVDIHAQKLAEQALQRAARRKDEFLAMLGHELRNPLAPIRNAAEVLRALDGTEPARLTWVRETITRQVDYITRLVDDLLDISRITRGTLRLQRSPVDLTVVVQRAVDQIRPFMQRKRHRLELNLFAEPVWVEGDVVRLTQIVENLLTNAAKYTDDGGDIQVQVAIGDGEALVCIRDSGLGLAPEMQARVFELFVQDERSIDRSQGGLGIGLALVRHLVDLHGGSVRAASRGIGHGSEFTVRLPRLATAPDPQPDPERAPVGADGARVLLVDDDPDAAESLSMVLRMFGYEVRVAGDLEAALRAADRFAPQAVILDLGLPGADGYEVARRLRAVPQAAGAAMVALTGYGRDEDVERSMREGFAHHLVKPADPAELHRLLHALTGAPA